MKLAIKKGRPWSTKLPVRCGPGGPYFRVFIFRDAHELREYARMVYSGTNDRRCRRAYWRHTEGCCIWFGKNSIERRPMQIGMVLLCRERIGAGIVSHEMTHAAHFHLTKGRLFLTPRQTEPLAMLQGHLVTSFWRWFYRRIG